MEHAGQGAPTKEDAERTFDTVDPDAVIRRPHRGGQWGVLVVIAIGGIFGAEARLGLARALPHAPGAFPWSTLLTNVIGCLFIGALMVTVNELTSPHRLARPFLGIGVLGGFTTFSTFTVDAAGLIQVHRPGLALVYVVCTLAAAGAAVAVGTIIARIAGGQIVNSLRALATRRGHS